MRYYGNLINRLEENGGSVKPEVGMGVTEYLWSDRRAYEIVEVTDEKHFKMREYEAKNVGSGYGDNSWELISKPDGYVYEMVFRYGSWYHKQKRCYGEGYEYRKMKIRIGVADYYYDFEF